MAFPEPIAGLVIRYAFLWHAEYLKGQDEGLKDRPCTIVLSTHDDEGDRWVTVLPITHTPPADAATAIEIPIQTKRRLGLDDAQSWVVLTEANQFVWPGPDLRPTQRGNVESVAYGELPANVFRKIRDGFIKALMERAAKTVKRSS